MKTGYFHLQRRVESSRAGASLDSTLPRLMKSVIAKDLKVHVSKVERR